MSPDLAPRTISASDKVAAHHLDRLTVVYVRRSTLQFLGTARVRVTRSRRASCAQCVRITRERLLNHQLCYLPGRSTIIGLTFKF
jgi:hypothetical protein